MMKRVGFVLGLVALALVVGLFSYANRPSDEVEIARVSVPGDSLWVHYSGWLPTGSLFDSSKDREPLAMKLGVTGLIDGWTEGVTGMQLGESRRLVIPPELGYGTSGREQIPPHSVLIFEVELVKLTPQSGD